MPRHERVLHLAQQPLLLKHLNGFSFEFTVEALPKDHVIACIVEFEHEGSDESQCILLIENGNHAVKLRCLVSLVLPPSEELVLHAKVPLCSDDLGFERCRCVVL